MKKKLKKLKKLPGVTLLELVIVMAIFSGISVGALAMVRPALQLHYKTAAQERAVAAVDTMARFIQDNLRYADKMFVFTGHGIKDIDTIQNYPFGFENFNSEIDFIDQKVTSSGGTGGTGGTKDNSHYVNPVTAFLQYYYEASIEFDERKADDVKKAYFDNYFKDKVIYVMEIKNTGEVNVYSYPLADYSNLSKWLIKGDASHYNGAKRPCSSLSSVFSQNENIKVKNIIPGVNSSDGLNCELSIEYKGATMPLTLNYNIAVNFINLTSLRDTISINDNYGSHDAKRYIVFDWGTKDRVVSIHLDESSYYSPSKAQRATDPGYTYIVYSLPEIIP